MSKFYKRDPADWMDGTNNLNLEQEAAYSRVVDATALYDQAPRHNITVLCGLWRCAPRKAERLLRELIDAGKLVIIDGRVVNERAVDEASKRRALSVDRASSGRRGGIESGKARAKALKDNESMQAPASTRIEENRIEESPPTPQGGRREIENDFEEWWKHVPLKVGKGQAKRAYSRARKKVDAQTLADGIKRFALLVQGKDRQFICHPSTWLNGERWSDSERVERPTETADPETILALRVERAKVWLSRHDTIATHMDNLEVAKKLVEDGYDYEGLRRAGFSLPIRGRVVEISTGGRSDAKHAAVG